MEMEQAVALPRQKWRHVARSMLALQMADALMTLLRRIARPFK